MMGIDLNQEIGVSKKNMVCLNCEYIGEMKHTNKGSCFMFLVLTFFFIIPGVIYAVWRLLNDGYQCPECKSWETVKPTTNRGKKILKSQGYLE